MVQDNDPGDGGSPLSRLLEALRSGRAPLPIIGGLAALVVIGIIFVAVALSSGGDDGASPTTVAATRTRPTATAASGGLRTAQPTPQATIDLERPTAEAQNLTAVGEEDRMVIPKFDVNAPLTYRAVGADGVMPNPEGPDDIAVYDFSAWPGKGGSPGSGNLIAAGHVDSGFVPCNNGTVPPPCTAVLWDLSNLVVGDTIEVHFGGEVYVYEVVSNEPVPAATGPWEQIVSSTAKPSLTIITCGGDFNRETNEYTNRQVLTAVLVT